MFVCAAGPEQKIELGIDMRTWSPEAGIKGRDK